MKYGIQVNVGSPGTPNWQWLHRYDMTKGEWDTAEEATAQMREWHPSKAKAHVFRVERIDDNP